MVAVRKLTETLIEGAGGGDGLQAIRKFAQNQSALAAGRRECGLIGDSVR